MIISHKYKFIFLKTTKTAGTSVEIALSKFCGPTDVITPITPEDEKIRQEFGFRGPQNYLQPVWELKFREVLTYLRHGYRKNRFYNHITASEVSQLVEPKVWQNYYKFCIERNPWDRVVSMYYWQYKTEPRPAFAEYVLSDAPADLNKKGFELYTINGQIAVDKICRYESLAEELEAVRLHLGLPEELTLPHAKSRFRQNKGSYRDLYGEAEKSRVADLFSAEIKLLGFEF